MKKLLFGVVALLATGSVAMAGAAAFSFGAVDPVDNAVGKTVTVPLWVTGNTEVDAISLGLEVQSPLQFGALSFLQPGMLLATSNDGGSSYLDPSGLAATFDAFNASTTIHNPALSNVPMLVGNLSVVVPAGTPKGDYTISTVSPLFGDYASSMSYAGAGLDITQAQGIINVVPEPMTALLLLGVLPLLRRRHA